MKIAVFCGSSDGEPGQGYPSIAFQLGEQLAANGHELVYGGAHVGLMGAVADGALSKGGRVTGVLPHKLADRELAHPELTELRLVEDMHERKALMSDLADAFIAMPGGVGTYEELFEVWCWAQLGIHHKPCALYNVHGFYDKLVEFLDHATEQQFVRPQYRDMLIVSDSATEIIDSFTTYQPPAEKWRDSSEQTANVDINQDKEGRI